MAATTPGAGESPQRSPSGPVPGEVMRQYLDALLKGCVFPEAQKKEVSYAVLYALAAEDPALQEDAAKVIGGLSVLERWKLGTLIDDINERARALILPSFAAFRVGMLPEDFARAVAREYEPNRQIFSAGDEADAAFLIEEGTVVISKGGRRITTYGKNATFGHLPFLMPVRRTADAFALSKLKVKELSRAAYNDMFAHYTPARQRDEFLLANAMIRQLITGFAQHESFHKVMVDSLFPGQPRDSQKELLVRWINHFTSPERYGEDRLYALFNILEAVDREMPFLVHLETADKSVLAAVAASEKGLLQGLGVSHLSTPKKGMQILDCPARLHRLSPGFALTPGLEANALEVVFLADFLLPAAGSRKAVLTPEHLQNLVRLLKPGGAIYFAGAKSGPNYRLFRHCGFNSSELAAGLYVLSHPGGPIVYSESASERLTGFFRRLLPG